ncbi:BNR-4 repeat-containing protein [Natronococcus wangiae]|uniref:BNR-4 repeat-containing protein n=1 Tax=Natronococcus wangiae TaxID=3068275 RepID=UPI00273F7C5C|nr:BNR-4 repeat-containing protein [Natronococcus sp. AD5]
MSPRSPLRDGLLGYWPAVRSHRGTVWDESPRENHGRYGRDARWIWFTNPRAVRYANERDRTYVGYLGGPTGTDIVIGGFDHEPGEFERTTLEPSFSADDHTSPSVLVGQGGRLLVFWSGHNGGAIRYRRSTKPEDLASFGPIRSIEQECVTYPNPIQLEGEPNAPIYLFYRDRTVTTDATDDPYGYVGDGHVHYRRSVDGGDSWSEQTRLVTAPEGHYGTYFVHAATDETIHLFFTDAERGGDAPKRHVLYAAFEDGTLFAADGEPIATESELPVTVSDLERVYDSAAPDGEYAWVWDASVDERGEPAVVYATFPSTLAHTYRYARWDAAEGKWRDHYLRDAGRYVEAAGVERHYSAGVALDPDDPTVAYACVSADGYRAVERLETDTGGRSWSVRSVCENPVGTPIRPVVPANAGDDCPALWLEGSYESMHASQTVLRGLPTDAVDGRIDGDGETGVTLGLDLFGERAVCDGVSASALVRTRDVDRRQTILQFGEGIRLDIARETAGALELSLADETSTTMASWDGLAAGDERFVEGAWDPDDGAMQLRVDGTTVDEAPFSGPIAFDEPNASWTLGKDAYLLGSGLLGDLREVRLYGRSTTMADHRDLRKYAKESVADR